MNKIAINGFGRIGRPTLKKILDDFPKLEVVAINDLTEPKTLAHLLKYDSNYGIYNKSVKAEDNNLVVNGQKIKILSEAEPNQLPWKELAIDIVLECTGRFTNYQDAHKHIEAGAKKVIISAPTKDEETPICLLGVNEKDYNHEKDEVISMGSCSTNALGPVAKILNDEFGIETGTVTTIHSYTNDQRLLDLPHKDLRRARAAALSIIPTSTGAVIAVTKAIPDLKGKIDGLALRVPTSVVSILDFVTYLKKDTTTEEVNYILRKASETDALKDILGVEDAPLVSIDYKGNSFSGIVDALSTKVENKRLAKILIWYDNEWAYACRLAEITHYICQKF